MSATSQILAAIDAVFAASPAPPTSGDIAAAVLRAAAPVLFPEKPEPDEPRPLTTVKAIGHAGDWAAWRSMVAARDRLYACANQLDGALSPGEASLGLTDAEVEERFRAWWAQSYPTPPGPHALMTHIGWARHLIEQAGAQQQQPEQSR